MNKSLWVFAPAILVLGIVLAAYAEQGKGRIEPGITPVYEQSCIGECPPMFMFDKLGLDDRQKEAVREIRLKTGKDMIQREADIKLAGLELREVLSKDPVDMAAAESAVKKIAGLKAEREIALIKSAEEIRAKLSPEQRKGFMPMLSRFQVK